MARFFQVTPPSVHSTILTLERRGLITRAPGQARSIACVFRPRNYRTFMAATRPRTSRHLRAGMTANNPQTRSRPAACRKMQLEDWFAHNHRNPLDDSEFVPIMDMLIESFAHASAVTRPMPLVRPVISATFSSNQRT